MEAEFYGINSFLVDGSKILLEKSTQRKTRGYTCYEIGEPVLFKILNPRSRIVTIEERKWNPFLPFIESLWIASGRNNIEMPAFYVKKLKDFSDDGKFMRAGYGPRIRGFNNSVEDYEVSTLDKTNSYSVDQLFFVFKELSRDKNSRRAIITIGDPNKDNFSKGLKIKKTKDFPCTRSLHFLVNNNKLDLVVHMRSNDFLWGASAVNIFNFTFIQEYLASMLGFDLGCYYHIANNIHYYENHHQNLVEISGVTKFERDTSLKYSLPSEWGEFESEIANLSIYEQNLRLKNGAFKGEFPTEYTFFREWSNVIKSFYEESQTNILNLYLKKSIERKLYGFL